ncbi:MAG: hypothetical protein AAF318_03015 [Pseudomonadota bacterium]
MLKMLGLAALFAAGAATAHADVETNYNIAGKWTGKGFVQKNETARKINVRCEVEGKADDGQLAFDGFCRAMLVIKRDIGVTLTRTGDSYAGIYIGSDVGPAELSGTRTDAERLILTMTFPRNVNGDDVAVMTIEHGDPNAFMITTVDDMESGNAITTANISFTRAGAPVKKAAR